MEHLFKMSGDFPAGLVATRPASDPGQILVWGEGSGRNTSQSSCHINHHVQVVIQRPGDTLVIPSRAPHTVLNLDWSIGVTENILTHEMLLGEAHI